jgi:hypothetical protein
MLSEGGAGGDESLRIVAGKPLSDNPLPGLSEAVNSCWGFPNRRDNLLFVVARKQSGLARRRLPEPAINIF